MYDPNNPSPNGAANARYGQMDMASAKKARMDAARLQTAPAKDQMGHEVGGGSWATFLDGVEKTPWAAHAQYQSPSARQMAPGARPITQPFAGNQPQMPQGGAYNSQRAYNIDPSLLKMAGQGGGMGRAQAPATANVEPWNTPEFIKGHK